MDGTETHRAGDNVGRMGQPTASEVEAGFPASQGPEDQEQLRLWLEALGGHIEQLGVEAGALRNRLASLEGAYFSVSTTSEPRAEAVPGTAGDETFARLVGRLLSRVSSQE